MDEIKIEVATPNDFSTTDKGKLFEKIISDILECLDYKVTDEIAFSGMEIDVLASHNKLNQTIIAECKAYRNAVDADILKKLVGDIYIKGVSLGFLFYTSQLTKGAKGILEEIKSKDNNKLFVYSPSEIVELLIKNRRIVSNVSLQKIDGYEYSENDYLIISPYGKFWIKPVISSGINTAVFVYYADSGKMVDDKNLLTKLSNTDTSLKTLEWITNINTFENIKKNIDNQRDNIVPISVGDEWADYRPSRPQDFVGRENLLKDIFLFLDKVRKNETQTRMLGLQAPSGWGKSSTIVKLISKSRSSQCKNKYYIYGVDTRAATSNKYIELVLLNCLYKAMKEQFIPEVENLCLGSDGYILENGTLKNIFNYLKEHQKVILIYFDQFEELFLKEELFSLFTKFQQLINSVCAEQENIVIGFAWKTDTNIPANHPAYNLWHGFSDRRKDFKLNLFSSTEISSTITKLEKELGQKIDLKLRKTLAENCLGYPWLLKKLCIYIYNSFKSKENIDFILEKLNVKNLFEQDFNALTQNEQKCIKLIAERSPANIIEVSETYTSELINQLLHKRILIKSGMNVSLYWDIFKDYILTGKVPSVPETYIMTSQINTYCKVMLSLINNKKTNLNNLSTILCMKEGTIDNIIRDAIMVGNVKRINNDIVLLHNQENDLVQTMRNYCQNHVIYNKIRSILQQKTTISYDSLTGIVNDIYKGKMADKTLKMYTAKMLSWFLKLNLLNLSSDNEVSLSSDHFGTTLKDLSSTKSIQQIKHDGNSFLAGAPYEKVCELISIISNNYVEIKNISPQYRNSINMLKKMNLVKIIDGQIKLYPFDEKQTINKLKENVISSREIEYINQIIPNNSNINGIKVGEMINKKFNYKWKKASEIRTGNALMRWWKWIYEK